MNKEELIVMKITPHYQFHDEVERLVAQTEKEVYSVHIVKEDDDTFDVRIWDEREQESCEDIEEGRFETYEKAYESLKRIVSEHREVVFLRTNDDID